MSKWYVWSGTEWIWTDARAAAVYASRGALVMLGD